MDIRSSYHLWNMISTGVENVKSNLSNMKLVFFIMYVEVHSRDDKKWYVLIWIKNGTEGAQSNVQYLCLDELKVLLLLKIDKKYT